MARPALFFYPRFAFGGLYLLSLAAITVVLRSNFIRPSQIIAALIRPKALFVTSPHPLATVTVFPRPCGLLEALKHGLHSLPEWGNVFFPAHF